MDQTTSLSVVNLTDDLAQFSLTAGSLNVHIRYLGPNENFEVDTPYVSLMLLRPGDYRIIADGENNVTTLVVRAGDVEVTAGKSGAFNVRNGQMARLSGLDDVQQEISGAPPLDAFDGWTRDRDAREDRATISARYVPREMIGYEDLDANGRWVNIPPYGMVWQPTTVAVGWAPYHNGHWAWVSPWGWTWIDDMPWGFAPFHYGRWAFSANAWVWVPGAVAVRPVYSPALVAFVGGGMVPAGPGRSLPPRLPCERCLCAQRERRLRKQRNRDQSRGSEQHGLREPARGGRGHGGAARCLRRRPSGCRGRGSGAAQHDGFSPRGGYGPGDRSGARQRNGATGGRRRRSSADPSRDGDAADRGGAHRAAASPREFRGPAGSHSPEPGPSAG
jgi:hypothetical protein